MTIDYDAVEWYEPKRGVSRIPEGQVSIKKGLLYLGSFKARFEGSKVQSAFGQDGTKKVILLRKGDTGYSMGKGSHLSMRSGFLKGFEKDGYHKATWDKDNQTLVIEV